MHIKQVYAMTVALKYACYHNVCALLQCNHALTTMEDVSIPVFPRLTHMNVSVEMAIGSQQMEEAALVCM